VASEACRGGYSRQQSLSPSPYDIPAFGTRYRRAASVDGGGSGKTEASQLELCRPSPSTPPNNGVLYAKMERMFEVYRRYERSRSRQNATWSPPLTSDDLERLLVAEIKRAEDVRKGTKLQQRCRSTTKSPATHRDSNTEGRSRSRNGQSTCSKPSVASRQVAPKRQAVPPPTSRKNTRPQRPEAAQATAGTHSASTVWSNATHFTPPRSHSSRMSIPSRLSAVAYDSGRTQSPRASCRLSITTSRKFQTDRCRPLRNQRHPVSAQSATCITEKQQKVIGGSSARTRCSNISETAAIQPRSMSANRTVSSRHRSTRLSEMTIFNPEIPPRFTSRGPNLLRDGAASQTTSTQRPSQCDLPRPRADVVGTRPDATSTTRYYDGFGRGTSGCDAAPTPVRQRLRLPSLNRNKHPLTTAEGVHRDHGISVSNRQLTLSGSAAGKSRPIAPESRLSEARCTDITDSESDTNGISSTNSGSSNSLKLTTQNCRKLTGNYSDGRCSKKTQSQLDCVLKTVNRCYVHNGEVEVTRHIGNF